MLLPNTCQVGRKKMLKRNRLLVLCESVRPRFIRDEGDWVIYMILISNCLDKKKRSQKDRFFFLPHGNNNPMYFPNL